MADERREVQAGQWRAALAAARAEGYEFFDWLSAGGEAYFDMERRVLIFGTRGLG